MTTVLLTGYEAFGEYDSNPTARLAAELDGATVDGVTVVGRELPVAFERAFPLLCELVDAHDPAVVLSTGLSAGRPVLSIERVGINVRDTVGTPDNDDREVVDDPVDPNGPDAYFSNLPLREMLDAIRETGVPAELSNSAGTHLCNDVLYATRHYAETNDLALRSGFVHVPATHEQIARREEAIPSASFDAIRRGIEAVLTTVV